jgi:hypothetical protein
MNTSGYHRNFSTHSFSDRQKRVLILLSVALFPIAFSLLVFLLAVLLGNISFPEKIGSTSEWGEIITPENKAIVHDKFIISGTLSDQAKGQWVYLIESREGLFWPKYSLGNRAGTWRKSLSVYGKKGHFSSYLLATVDSKGRQVFEDWFAHSRKTGKYLGVKSIEAAQVVAKIRVKRK